MKKNYDESVTINHNQNWPYIPDYPYRILIIGFSGSFIRKRSNRTKVSITY